MFRRSRQPKLSSKLEGSHCFKACAHFHFPIKAKQSLFSNYLGGRVPELREYYCSAFCEAVLGCPGLPKSFQESHQSLSHTLPSMDSFYSLENVLPRNQMFHLGHLPLFKASPFPATLTTLVCQDLFQHILYFAKRSTHCTEQKSLHSLQFLLISPSPGRSSFLSFPPSTFFFFLIASPCFYNFSQTSALLLNTACVIKI